MLDISTFSTKDLKLFNDLIDDVLRDPATAELGVTVIARRFCDALEAGERDPTRLRAAVVGAETFPGDLDWPLAKRPS